MAERKKKWAKRLPRRRVHSMALGGVIKHMGWKLSRFIPCSRGVAGFCCCCCCCSCKMKFIHEHKLEANLLTCFADLPDVAVTLCLDRPRAPATSHRSTLELLYLPCPLLPRAACPAPGTTFRVQTRPYSFINDEVFVFLSCCIRKHLTLAETKYSPVTALW